ncbi:MAG: TetR/AcrR family transcriptional regulator [Pseudomonadota bacterium]
MGNAEAAFAAIDTQLSALRSERPSALLAGRHSAKGARTVKQILSAARRVFERDGHAKLTLRGVAAEAGVTVGNLNYYFSSKELLLHAMLKEALAEYADAHVQHIADGDGDPLETLLNIVAFYVGNARGAYPLFFQMWGYAGAEPEARELVSALYLSIGRLTSHLVAAANPNLDDQAVRQTVLQIFSLEEGVKLFIGLSDPNGDAMRNVEDDVKMLTRRIVTGSTPFSRTLGDGTAPS